MSFFMMIYLVFNVVNSSVILRRIESLVGDEVNAYSRKYPISGWGDERPTLEADRKGRKGCLWFVRSAVSSQVDDSGPVR